MAVEREHLSYHSLPSHLSGALVVDDGGLRPPEEALASLAGDDAVVDAGALVPAHLAWDDLDLSCGGKRGHISGARLGAWAVGEVGGWGRRE